MATEVESFIGSVLLEEYALALVPHGPFLLEQLTAPQRQGGPAGLLAVGDVRYDQKPAALPAADLVAARGPASGEGKRLTWKEMIAAKQDLSPKKYEWGANPVGGVPMPGVYHIA